MFNSWIIYVNTWLVWVFVCLFVSHNRQNGWADWAQIFCLFLFYIVYKEKIFNIEIADGRKAPCKYSTLLLNKRGKIFWTRSFFNCLNPQKILFLVYINVHRVFLENRFIVRHIYYAIRARHVPTFSSRSSKQNLVF